MPRKKKTVSADTNTIPKQYPYTFVAKNGVTVTVMQGLSPAQATAFREQWARVTFNLIKQEMMSPQ